MSIGRARVVKGAFPVRGEEHASRSPATDRMPTRARRIPKALLEGHEEAGRIVEEARKKADEIVEHARTQALEIGRTAASDARERELARLAAEVLTVRIAEERRRERTVDRTIEIASLLAERLVGESLKVDPERIRTLAIGVLAETRGARKIRIEAHPEDMGALSAFLTEQRGPVIDVEPSNELERGSLVVHTELGRIDARLRPQLQRLGEALRDVIQSSESDP